jgi:cell division protein FtsA
MLDVLGILPPTYYLDGILTEKPIEKSCKRVEAHYKLIVGKPAIRNNIINCFKRTKLQLAGIFVSPLALADAVFNDEDKESGCALIDFGAGVTSVVVYAQNELVQLSVFPLGGNVITKDLTSLELIESQAEQLKITYGSAVKEKNTQVDEKEGIALNKINTIVEARSKEIVENVFMQVKLTGKLDAIEKIVLAGNASSLKNLQDLVHDRFKKETFFSIIGEEWIEGVDDRIGNPLYMTAISLLIKGTENCIYSEETIQDVEKRNPNEGEKKEKIKEKKSEGGNFFDRLIEGLINPD